APSAGFNSGVIVMMSARSLILVANLESEPRCAFRVVFWLRTLLRASCIGRQGRRNLSPQNGTDPMEGSTGDFREGRSHKVRHQYLFAEEPIFDEAMRRQL